MGPTAPTMKFLIKYIPWVGLSPTSLVAVRRVTAQRVGRRILPVMKQTEIAGW